MNYPAPRGEGLTQRNKKTTLWNILTEMFHKVVLTSGLFQFGFDQGKIMFFHGKNDCVVPDGEGFTGFRVSG